MNDGKKKKAQKHQNKIGFKIKFDTKALETQKKVTLHLLCKRCIEQIQWKLKYNKYKKIAEPGKCNFCHEKNVVRSYMKACDTCAQSLSVCPKCLSGDYEMPEDVRTTEQEKARHEKETEKERNAFIESLRERSRRTIRRKLQKGTISWNEEMKYFVDEEDNEVTGLHFRKTGLDLDLDDDYNESEDNDFGFVDDNEEEMIEKQ